jgi:SAM-dependent methyltransferase
MPAGPAPRYDSIGRDYTAHRRPDPRWAALINEHLHGARRVLNVGAGTGSYEPAGPAVTVVAVEPSSVMVAQRAPGAAAAIRGSGTALPFPDRSFDAVLAVLTVHHWGDWRAGLMELRRVAPLRVILAIDFEAHADLWLLRDYLPAVAAVERTMEPSAAQMAAHLPAATVVPLPLPPDLSDGVLGAHWRVPEAYLDPVVRANCSPLALADQAVVDEGMARLAADLANGDWQRANADLLQRDSFDAGYRLVVSDERTSAGPGGPGSS